MPLLSEMLGMMPISANLEGNAVVEITDITTDSRQVKPGSLYIAIRGTKVDGHQFVADAVNAGAAAVVVDQDTIELPVGKTLVQVADSREALAHFAAAFYPEHPPVMMAVTGTDGKTSTADFVRQLCTKAGHRAASIGTLGLLSDDEALSAMFAASHTSPDPLSLHKMLSYLARSGVECVAMEASSHGIHQYRMEGVPFSAAAMTNVTRDHLDYHGTVEAYAEAKLRLFSEVLPEGKHVVINADDPIAARVEEIARARGCSMTRYGMKGEELRIVSIEAHKDGLTAQLVVEGRAQILSTPLYGAFQIYNMLAAVGLAKVLGHPMSALVALCGDLKNVPGRMERVAETREGAGIFIDYAHTPAALQKALEVARPHISGKLHVVFGCGGDRDKGKRPLMGEVAQKYADHVIVTDDNPRSEVPAQIRAEIMAACPKATEIGDRADAIAIAVSNLKAQDALIVAGKGHETTQTIGEQVFPFNDAVAIKEALARL